MLFLFQFLPDLFKKNQVVAVRVLGCEVCDYPGQFVVWLPDPGLICDVGGQQGLVDRPVIRYVIRVSINAGARVLVVKNGFSCKNI